MLTVTVDCGVANPLPPLEAVVVQGWADLNCRLVWKYKIFLYGDIRLLLYQIVRKDVFPKLKAWPSKEAKGALQIKSEASLDPADTTPVHELAHSLELHNLMRPHKAENRGERAKACNKSRTQLS